MCQLSTVLVALLLVDLDPDVDLAALPVDPNLGALDHGDKKLKPNARFVTGKSPPLNQTKCPGVLVENAQLE